jgi:hypothetical protein
VLSDICYDTPMSDSAHSDDDSHFDPADPLIDAVGVNPYAPSAMSGEVEFPQSGDTEAEAYRRRYLRHEASIKSVGFLFLIPGYLFAFYLASGIAMSVALFFNGSSLAFSSIELGVVLLVYGAFSAVNLYVGHGLRRFWNGARVTASLLCAFGLLMSLPLIGIGFSGGDAIVALVLCGIQVTICGYVLFLLNGDKGQTVFSADYQEAIRLTPHLKYRTTPLVWALLLLLAFVVLRGLAAFFGLSM